ncbi:uncharacterized protein B0H64DRAFT_191954 [Chaetomium fimeti]|uniref:Uncharacterized protein n=1 Tax=Chaetomium fimeti TaxID=1854472 RepID=A0AAE0HDQ3_9PEZI|nr:hypothetical protein B0H64DRAFT_191954 [Chaetomium fimeti]
MASRSRIQVWVQFAWQSTDGSPRAKCREGAGLRREDGARPGCYLPRTAGSVRFLACFAFVADGENKTRRRRGARGGGWAADPSISVAFRFSGHLFSQQPQPLSWIAGVGGWLALALLAPPLLLLPGCFGGNLEGGGGGLMEEEQQRDSACPHCPLSRGFRSWAVETVPSAYRKREARPSRNLQVPCPPGSCRKTVSLPASCLVPRSCPPWSDKISNPAVNGKFLN